MRLKALMPSTESMAKASSQRLCPSTARALRRLLSATTAKVFQIEDRRGLIEPYVTTRAEGTGLGLPIVVKIFEDHGGGVELLDGPPRLDGGRGAKVLMRLPLQRAEQNATPAENERIGSS